MPGQDILKAGVGIHGDAIKLATDYGIEVKGLVCLAEQANMRLKGPGGDRIVPQGWSLKGMGLLLPVLRFVTGVPYRAGAFMAHAHAQSPPLDRCLDMGVLVRIWLPSKHSWE